MAEAVQLIANTQPSINYAQDLFKKPPTDLRFKRV